MSLFSAIILPQLERELQSLEPQIAAFIVKQLQKVAAEMVQWAESKANIDLNGDGKIGSGENEA